MTQHIPAVFALVLAAMPAVFAGSNANTVIPPCLDALHGTWLDSRGIIFEVRGACDGANFSSNWTGSERGRTIYQLRGEELEVIDSVFPPAGPGREFGRSRLRR